VKNIGLDLNYFSFSNPNSNPTHLPKHQTLSQGRNLRLAGRMRSAKHNYPGRSPL